MKLKEWLTLLNGLRTELPLPLRVPESGIKHTQF